MVSARTGLSLLELNRLSRLGRLRGDSRNSCGLTLYSEATVRQFLKTDGSSPDHRLPAIASSTGVTYSAPESVAVATMLRDGRTLEDIHIDTQIHPLIIKTIADDIAKLRDSILIPKSVLDMINALPIEGNLPVADADEIYAILKSYARQGMCGRCRTRMRSRQCATCVRETTPKPVAQPEETEETTDDSGS